MATTGPIGGAWVANFSPDHGRFYFANPTSGETTWEWPADLPKPEVSAEGWVAARDPSSGNVYYANPAADPSTTWSVPTEVVRAVVASGGADAAPAPAPEPAAAPAAAGGAGGDAPAPAPASAADAASPTPTPTPTPTAAAAAEDSSSDDDVPAKKAPEPETEENRTTFNFAKPGAMAAATKELWRKILQPALDEAQLKITTRNAKYERLRQFNKIRSKKKKEDAERREREAREAAAEAEAERSVREKEERRSVFDMLAIEVKDEPEKKSMEEYAETYFNLNRKGIFKSRTTVAKVLSWKDDVIKMALKDMGSGGSELNAAAIQTFRNITGFMGDRSTKKEDGGHAEKMLKISLHSPEELRDEVYCQLVKQTTNNTNADSLLKGWQLFAIVTGALSPSKTLEPYLMSYFHTAARTGTAGTAGAPGVKEYAEYCLGRLTKVVKMGPRREIPTGMEIEACKMALPVPLRVYYVDGTFDYMPVTSWTTPTDLKNMVCEMLGISSDNREAFAIYEMTPENEERYLDADERILDLVAYWQRLYDEEKQKDSKKEETNTYRVVFKVHMYFEPVPTSSGAVDVAAERLLYIQAVYDVISARYPCGEDDQLSLASLQRQVDKPQGTVTKEMMGRYLQAKLLAGTRVGELTMELNKRLGAHAGKKPSDARKEYLTYVKKWKIYGSSFFFVEPQMSTTLPDEVFLAVNPKGILLINPDTKAVVAEHPYSEIPTWGHSGSSFVLHIGNLLRQTKLYFRTEQGKEINDLVRSYVNHMVVVHK